MEDELYNEAETDAAMRDQEEEEEDEELEEEEVDDQPEDDEGDDDGEEDGDDEEGEEGEEGEEEDDDREGEENEAGENENEEENEDDDNEDDDNNEEDEDDDMEVDGEADDNEEENANDNEEEETNDNESKLSAEDDDHIASQDRLITSAKEAKEFDIIPSVAIPYSSQCHTIELTDGPKWLFTGGDDGFIRKYDFIASIEGKSPLTMAQKHSLVDSITKAGVINSYWENEQPITKRELGETLKKFDESTLYEPKTSPVHALAVERSALWLLSGLNSGGITLQSVRYNESAIQHYFKEHTSTISVIRLNDKQDRFISGSWDKQIIEWDLNTGKTISNYRGSSGQVSNIQFRPLGVRDEFAVDNSDEPAINGKVEQVKEEKEEKEDDLDSLFGSDEEEDESKILEKLDTKPKSPIKEIVNEQSNTTTVKISNDNIFMSSCIDGSVNVWDNRAGEVVVRYGVPQGTPPWAMSSVWSNDGDYIYIGRRNSTIEEFSLKMPLKQNKPNVSKTLKFPAVSGQVSIVQTMPNNDFLLCGSQDNIRLYDLKLYDNSKKSQTPFLIIPGHHGGVLSSLYVDPTGRFMVSASGNRGWQGQSTENVLIYEIDF